MKRIAVAATVACLLGPTSSWAQAQDHSWTIVPQLGLAFAGGYYDDLVRTTFPGGGSDIERLKIDPGVAVRLAVSAEYAATSTMSLYGSLAGSWPGAEAVEDIDRLPDIDMSVYEISVGALFRLGEWAAGTKVLPFYVGGDVNLVFHSFDDLIWQGELTDVTTTSLGLSGKFGVGYAIGPKLMLRGEGRLHIVRGGFGGLEDELAAAAALDEGEPSAQTDLDGSTFTIFTLNAGLAIRL